MPVVLSMIRNSSQKVLCFGILFLASCISTLFLFINHKIFTQVRDFSDLSTLFLFCFGIITVIMLTSFISPLLLFAFEYSLSGKKSNISRYLKHLKNHENLWYLVCLDITFLCLYMCMDLKFNWDYFTVMISASLLFACVIVWTGCDEVELSLCQNTEQSIGAFWAYGAYLSFYKRILIDIPKRMSQFEDAHHITLLVKKLVMIVPLSCNANGSLEGKDGNLKVVGCLEEITEDEGANNNRTYKTNVYKICGTCESYIAAEIPSPLATLYEMRDEMDYDILQYHRRCFIETLKDLLKSDQCIILEYDDLNYPEPLHKFLLSELEDQKFVNVIK